MGAPFMASVINLPVRFFLGNPYSSIQVFQLLLLRLALKRVAQQCLAIRSPWQAIQVLLMGDPFM